jgi:hypothetical protein
VSQGLFGELGRLVDWDEHVAALLEGFELFGDVDAVPVHDDGHGQSIPSFLRGFEEWVGHAWVSDGRDGSCAWGPVRVFRALAYRKGSLGDRRVGEALC